MNTLVVDHDERLKETLISALYLEDNDETTLREKMQATTAHALVIGPRSTDPLAVAQRMARVDKQMAVLIVPGRDAEAGLREQRLLTPFLGADVRILDCEAQAQLEQVVDQARSRTVARRRHLKLDASIIPDLEIWRPDTFPLWETLLEQLPVGLAVLDPNNQILVWNDYLEQVTGVTAAVAMAPVGNASEQAVHIRLFMQFLRNFSGDDDCSREYCIENMEEGADSHHFVVTRRRLQGNLNQRGNLLIIQDVTERILAQQQRLDSTRNHADSQRLESLGLLAGGIAHDFNDILMTILGNAELGLSHLRDSGSLQTTLNSIISATHRASDLTRQMLSYAGKSHVDIRTHDLNAIINETRELLLATITKSAQLSINLRHGLLYVNVDQVQMQQVLLNLVLNASDALGRTQGEIAVTTSVQVVHEDRHAAHSDLPIPAGEYALIEVRDTGRGIEQKHLRKIFEPFFTTKSTGRGLGLSAVLGIVGAHGGEFTVESELGVGSCFSVRLPLAISQLELSQKSNGHGTVLAPPEGTTVLVVDDEEFVRSIAARLLVSLGYEVVTAESGEEGLEKILAGLKPNLVLLDHEMPGITGLDFLQQLASEGIEVPVVLCSGYSDVDKDLYMGFSNLCCFLPKPYAKVDLEKTLLKVIFSVDDS